MILLILIVASAIWFGFVITGISFNMKGKKVLGWIFISIPLLCLVGIIIYFKSYFHSTNPTSLHLEVVENGNVVTITGEWQEKLERNALQTDYLLFFTSNDRPIESAHFPDTENEMEYYIAYKLLQMQDFYDLGKPQLYEVPVAESFRHEIPLPDGLQISDLKIYYMHFVDLFPDPLKWIKRVYP